MNRPEPDGFGRFNFNRPISVGLGRIGRFGGKRPIGSFVFGGSAAPAHRDHRPKRRKSVRKISREEKLGIAFSPNAARPPAGRRGFKCEGSKIFYIKREPEPYRIEWGKNSKAGANSGLPPRKQNRVRKTFVFKRNSTGRARGRRSHPQKFRKTYSPARARR